jgi:hypothetical protein
MELAITIMIPEDSLDGSGIEIVEELVPLSTRIDFSKLLPRRSIEAFQPSSTHFVTASIPSSNSDSDWSIPGGVSLNLNSRPLLPFVSEIAEMRLGCSRLPMLHVRLANAIESLNVGYDAWSGIIHLAWKDKRRHYITAWTLQGPQAIPIADPEVESEDSEDDSFAISNLFM